MDIKFLLFMLVPVACIIVIAIIGHLHKSHKRKKLSDPHHDSVYHHYNKRD